MVIGSLHTLKMNVVCVAGLEVQRNSDDTYMPAAHAKAARKKNNS